MKILDCTLRDGGYYTNWDFPEDVASSYLRAMGGLPVDAVEIGYRSKPLPGYYGKYFYCPQHVLEEARRLLVGKKIAVMFNEKDTGVGELETYLPACKGLVDIIRFAVDPDKIDNMPALIERVKGHGFEAAVNLMYASNYSERVDELIAAAKTVEGADYLNLVDSYGGVYPDDLRKMIQAVKSEARCQIGFHGHDNLELAFANALVALEAGCEWVDATVTGMGRGAGNLKTELLLTHLRSRGGPDVDMDCLSNLVSRFASLQAIHGWGTNLPYMVSGASSLPQKDVMDWVTKRYLSINTMIRALENQRAGIRDNVQLPGLEGGSVGGAILIGGGDSAALNSDAIIFWLKKHPDHVVIHSSSRHAAQYSKVTNKQFYCLVGNEADRLQRLISADLPKDGCCVMPPYPRKMGTVVAEAFAARTFELSGIEFTKSTDSCTALALQTAVQLGANTIWVAGYDGYQGSQISARERELFMENEKIFSDAAANGLDLRSLTPTCYEGLARFSVHAQIV